LSSGAVVGTGKHGGGFRRREGGWAAVESEPGLKSKSGSFPRHGIRDVAMDGGPVKDRDMDSRGKATLAPGGTGRVSGRRIRRVVEIAECRFSRNHSFLPKSLTITLAMALVASCGCKTTNDNTTAPKDETTISTVENDIRAHLPTGSSRADVTAYLDQRRIPHSWLQKGEVSPDGQIVIPNSHTEIGIIPDARTDGFIFKIFTSIQMEFKFDDSDSRLVSYSVREVYEGP